MTCVKGFPCILQLLEEICQKNNWGSPIYSLHSSTSTTPSGEPDTLFLYKATIVGIGMTYIPSKLCRNLPEAREIAAEHSLIQLGYPMEGEWVDGWVWPHTESEGSLAATQLSYLLPLVRCSYIFLCLFAVCSYRTHFPSHFQTCNYYPLFRSSSPYLSIQLCGHSKSPQAGPLGGTS